MLSQLHNFKPTFYLPQDKKLFIAYHCIETQMENISTSTSLNNSVPSLSSMEVPPRADGIALCSAFVFEAVLILAGNVLTIVFFAMKKKLRKKSLLLVINMAFADVMVGTVSLPLYIYLWVGPHN